METLNGRGTSYDGCHSVKNPDPAQDWIRVRCHMPGEDAKLNRNKQKLGRYLEQLYAGVGLNVSLPLYQARGLRMNRILRSPKADHRAMPMHLRASPPRIQLAHLRSRITPIFAACRWAETPRRAAILFRLSWKYL